jgi:DsbC/DsbD-like thiol-disulfide interchange protein
MIRTLLSALALLATTAAPLAAQSNAITPATGEILPGWVQSDGSYVAAIKLTLAPGWKTYWRTPGDAGIPPRFNWSRSSNLRGGVAITWPTPNVYKQNGMRTIGYSDEVVLPITLAPRRAGKPVKLRADLDIGVCKDICVPYQLSLKATLDLTSTTPTPAIAAALAARPYGAAEAGVSSATCTLRPNADGLEIETHLTLPKMGRNEVVVIEPGQPGVWMSETDTTRRGNVLIATGDLVPSGNAPLVIDRSDVVITVISARQAVEIKGCTPG